MALINWDDYYIHSSDDDLWQVDQTQLKRNAFLIAAMAYYLGKATPADVPLLLSETRAQGVTRLANDLKAAVNEIQTLDDADEAYKNAHLLIEQGFLREERALNSLSKFAENQPELLSFIDQNIQSLKKTENSYFDAIRLNYKMRFGNDAPENPVLNENEKMAQLKIPVNIDNLAEYYKNRKLVKFKGQLHSTMQFELYNFVDGKRSYFDIYKALKAENLAASRFYYGEVVFDDVVKRLDEAVEKNVVRLK